MVTVLDPTTQPASKEQNEGNGHLIGSTIGEVLEVDVSEIGVQWGKCLRVRVQMDVTKKLVRGKRVTIEGGKEDGYSSNMRGCQISVITVVFLVTTGRNALRLRTMGDNQT